MLKPKILLTQSIHPQAMQLLAAEARLEIAADDRPETLRQGIRDAAVLVARRTVLPADIFEDAPQLLGVVRHGVGVETVPLEAANRHLLPVANVPGTNAQPVAEYAISAMLNLSRQMPWIEQQLRQEEWQAARLRANTSTELYGKTAGIIGLGHVGSRIARICHLAFDMRVLALRRRAGAPDFVQEVANDTLFAESDFVVLCCPLTPETRRMVNARVLALMKPSAFLINVARGEVVDEEALVHALQAGCIRGAALDVFATEPLPVPHRLRALPNVILTPHFAGTTAESTARMSFQAAEESLRLLRGEKPLNLINPDVWDMTPRQRR